MATRPSKSDLVAWWQMDEASGNAIDAHTGGIDLTDVNTVGSAQGGRDFNDSNNEFFRTSDSNLSWGDEAMTITGWMWMDNVSVDHAIVARWSNSGNYRQFFFQNDESANNWRFNADPDGTGGSDTNLTNSTKGTATGEWIYWAIGHDPTGNELRLRINSTDATKSWSSGLSGISTDYFRVGAIGNLGRHHDGKMKCVNAWDAYLSSNELDWLYNGGTEREYSEMVGVESSMVGPLSANFYKRPSGIIAPRKKIFTIPVFPLPVGCT